MSRDNQRENKFFGDKTVVEASDFYFQNLVLFLSINIF